jgi:protein-S-isoprenylcysteine O-methyltransferase Ste14
MYVRWKNVPVPEVHIAGLVAAASLHLIKPVKIRSMRRFRQIIAFTALGTGLGIASWAVAEIAEMAIASPSKLISTGPYAFSRNPMYIGWTLINIGIGLLAHTGWTVICLPPVLIATHRVILREERQLEQQFGDSYRAYKTQVRRYL